MEKIILTILFSISKWQCLHYEITDNGFLSTSAPDSMTAYLFGVRDNVGGVIFKTTNGGINWQELHPWTIEDVFFFLWFIFFKSKYRIYNSNGSYMVNITNCEDIEDN